VVFAKANARLHAIANAATMENRQNQGATDSLTNVM
jgi:hypothetical protein